MHIAHLTSVTDKDLRCTSRLGYGWLSFRVFLVCREARSILEMEFWSRGRILKKVTVSKILNWSNWNASRMHSSRMRTAHFSGCLYRGVSASGSGGCLPHTPRTCPLLHTYTPGHSPFSTPPGHTLFHHTPFPYTPFLPHTDCGQTDACENITLPHTSFGGGKKLTKWHNWTPTTTSKFLSIEILFKKQGVN